MAEIVVAGFKQWAHQPRLPVEDVSHCDGNPMLFNDEEPSPPVIEEEQDAEEVAYGGGSKVGRGYEKHFIWAPTVGHPFLDEPAVKFSEVRF